MLSEKNIITNNNQYIELKEIKQESEVDKIVSKKQNIAEDTNANSLIINDNSDSGDLKLIKDNWEIILESIKKQKISLNAIIKEAQPFKVINNEVILKFTEKYTFHMNRANTKESIELIEQIFKNILTRDFKIKFIIEDTSINESNEEIKTKLNQKAYELFGKEKVEIID